MSQLKCNEKEKIHFVWFIILMVCVVITYCYQKSRANSYYRKILQTAAENCSYEVIELLVGKNVVYVDEIGSSGLTPLGYASNSGCLKVVRFLVDKEANIHVTSKYGSTALHNATHSGNLEVIEFLLEKGANPNTIDNNGKTPRGIAALRSRHNKDKPYDQIIKLLAEAEDRYESTKSNH
ncbi:ankyrin repeat domain-containing protein [Wolbachia endosymbiont of Leptopilina clavipes]|uniref:ankyrin repeat domain-containing protein n=1 Tax=Wolbachia endosymbiont of Leptopilina clavipes TaxID=260213 RepID=UPI001119ABAC|nr:ankyrin repeat domain-containing protein [Wolbachia endosymbiont of Leptopilina clavipes]TNK93734.1 ankyrin repeat domain-containing protein [Wolbachia endosymbiont of Leptopilina clavipes]